MVMCVIKKVKKETLFDAAYNNALNKLYHYSCDAKIIFDLAMALINGAIQEDVYQMKEAKYIEYIIELTEFNYKDEIETYHQIASHTYPIQEAQIQQLKQINIQLCEEYIMSYDDKWCSECYAFSILLSNENNQKKIEFKKLETKKKLQSHQSILLKTSLLYNSNTLTTMEKE
ncbi:hypothetical protein G9A89_000162 [Geosiphon pyriformis]|nr:hypothetical protein G9A89_000162 [Geosiphon pyriformis]